MYDADEDLSSSSTNLIRLASCHCKHRSRRHHRGISSVAFRLSLKKVNKFCSSPVILKRNPIASLHSLLADKCEHNDGHQRTSPSTLSSNNGDADADPLLNTISSSSQNRVKRQKNPQELSIHVDVICCGTLECPSGVLGLDWRERFVMELEQSLEGKEMNRIIIRKRNTESDAHFCRSHFWLRDDGEWTMFPRCSRSNGFFSRMWQSTTRWLFSSATRQWAWPLTTATSKRDHDLVFILLVTLCRIFLVEKRKTLFNITNDGFVPTMPRMNTIN